MADHFSATYTFVNDTAVTAAVAYAGDATAAALPSAIPPKSVTLQAETNGIRIGFKQPPVAGSVGAVISAGNTGRFEGQGAFNSLKICNAAAGQNAIVHIVVEY